MYSGDGCFYRGCTAGYGGGYEVVYGGHGKSTYERSIWKKRYVYIDSDEYMMEEKREVMNKKILKNLVVLSKIYARSRQNRIILLLNLIFSFCPFISLHKKHSQYV